MFHIPAEYRPFVNSVKKKCKYHGIKLILSPSATVIFSDDYQNECSGYFSEDLKVLVAAVGKPAKDWIDLLVHESCHLDQWIQDKERCKQWSEACIAWAQYLAGEKLLNKRQLKKILDQIIEMERDCEERSIAKIKQWKLPVNLDRYQRGANAYLFMHRLMPQYKKFPIGMYNDDKLLQAAPNRLRKRFEKLPPVFEIEAHRFYKELLLKTA